MIYNKLFLNKNLWGSLRGQGEGNRHAFRSADYPTNQYDQETGFRGDRLRDQCSTAYFTRCKVTALDKKTKPAS